MDSKLAARVVAKYRVKTAGLPPFEEGSSPAATPPPGGGTTRNIPKDHPFDPRALKPMAKALWASSVALGHALASYQHLSRLKSGTISPDGMLGGRGYVMSVKDARQRLFSACEALSSIADTLSDEIQGPHWLPKLAQLDPNDAEDVSRFIEESGDILDNPEEVAERNLDMIEQENDGPGKTPRKKPEEEEAEASEMPDGGASMPSSGSRLPAKQASETDPVELWLRVRKQQRRAAREVTADSSINVDALPGPRVNDLDRGNQLGPYGSFNRDEIPSDNWAEGEREYVYQHEYENDYRETTAQSAMPSDDTPTEGYDYGLGYGAHGQGAGGYANPSGEGNGTKGVWGPHSTLPGTPPQSVGDTTPVVDVELNERRANPSSLPGDTEESVARTDYFPGWKGNLVQSESELPQGISAPVEQDVSLVDTGYVSEDVETPYVRYDDSTSTLRQDPLHNWPSEG